MIRRMNISISETSAVALERLAHEHNTTKSGYIEAKILEEALQERYRIRNAKFGITSHNLLSIAVI